MLSRFLFVLFLSLVSGQCKTEKKQQGPCSIKYHVCGQVNKLKWKYTCDASDMKSGIKAHAGAHDSATGAAEAATLTLYQTMKVDKPSNATNNATNPCNCQTNIEKVNPKCILSINTCYYFINNQDLKAAKPAFRVWALDMGTGLFGYNDNAGGYNVTRAVQDAITDLSTKESLLKCLAAKIATPNPFDPEELVVSTLA